MTTDPTRRFSDRADVYARFRPSYPRELTALLARECGLSAESRVADIGCGTGLLAEVLLDSGCDLTGVEPNAAMREEGRRMLAGRPRFRIVEGRAEDTRLPDASFDLITVGQAFHWFDPQAARAEFRRILRPGGRIVLVWNERASGGGFQADYDALVRRYAPEINRIKPDAIDTVFGGRVWREVKFENRQVLDLEGLQGRLGSSSYAPKAGTPEYGAMAAALAELFTKYEEEGRVTLLYDTLVYL